MNQDSERRTSYLAAALEEANATIRSKMDELSLVRRVGDAVGTSTSASVLAAEVVSAIAETVNCRHAALYAGPAASPFELQAVSSVFGETTGFPACIRNTRLAEAMERRRGVVQIDDIRVRSEWAADWPFPPELVSWVAVPLGGGGSLRGALLLADDRPGAFDERTLRTLMIIVPQVGGALANLDLYDNLRASETKYRTLVETMQDVVFICSRSWDIASVNAAAERFFGENPVGRKLTEFFYSRKMATQFMETVGHDRAIENFEVEIIAAKGQRAVVLISCTTDGERYSGLIKDVTERARLVDQVIRAQRMESVGTLAAGVAHDFNNILGIILPNAELIKMRAAGEPTIGKYADVIVNASKRASKLTKQLLTMARREPREMRVLDLNDAIRSMCRLFEQTIGKNLQIAFNFEGDRAEIRADESQIEQIVLNLSINARDAMPNGGSLTFSTRKDGANVILSVRDTGTGIASGVLPRIFDPFFTTKGTSNGTGLGLSVVYSLVKQIGGTVDVKSELGQGTEFQMTFPACAGDPGRTQVFDSCLPGGVERILIVDDEPEMLAPMRTTFENLGYDVVCAHNGLEAIERVSDDTQLVIMDLTMPVMDGLTALHTIRQKFPAMKVIVASGAANPDDLPKLRRMDIEGFVQKPFGLQKLAALARDILDGVTV